MASIIETMSPLSYQSTSVFTNVWTVVFTGGGYSILPDNVTCFLLWAIAHHTHSHRWQPGLAQLSMPASTPARCEDLSIAAVSDSLVTVTTGPDTAALPCWEATRAQLVSPRTAQLPHPSLPPAQLAGASPAHPPTLPALTQRYNTQHRVIARGH